jgi:putative ABC transport system permease protein
MALPLSYNVLSARERWVSSVVAVLGVAGAVGVFIAMLALSRGFEATLVSTGLPDNAIVQRAGADSEMTSIMTIDDVRVVEDAAQVAHGPEGPLVSPEVVVIAALPLIETGTDANVQVRGVTPRALAVHENVALLEGRFLTSGLPELVVGKGARDAYRGLQIGSEVAIGAGQWTVVGVLDGGGSSFDSEIWADASVLNGFHERPPNIYQSVVARLRSRGELEPLKTSLENDPRVNVQVMSEPEYYAQQSEIVTTLITVLGGLVAAVMALGAVFGALNTMYSAIAERAREIAVLRAIGFGEGSIVLAFFVEALLIALVGGVLGCILVLPVNGVTTGTMNWQTFSHLAFAFSITPDLLLAGLVFALLMGAVGGLPPAIRAARANVAHALRAL